MRLSPLQRWHCGCSDFAQNTRRRYTAFFSNTARAHQMNRTRDWVIIYYDDGAGERQCTVITSRHGALTGKRIVRGEEEACAAYYEKLDTAANVAAETVAPPIRLASGAN